MTSSTKLINGKHWARKLLVRKVSTERTLIGLWYNYKAKGFNLCIAKWFLFQKIGYTFGVLFLVGGGLFDFGFLFVCLGGC